MKNRIIAWLAAFAVLLTVLPQIFVSAAATVSVGIYEYINNDWLLESTPYEWHSGITVGELLKYCEDRGFTVTESGGRVTAITYEGVAYRDGENGAGSGWVYSVNGERQSADAYNYALGAGDSVVWYYITAPEGTSAEATEHSTAANVTDAATTAGQTAAVNSTAAATTAENGSQSQPTEEISSAATATSATATASKTTTSAIKTATASAADDYFDYNGYIRSCAEWLNKNPGEWTALALYKSGVAVSGKIKYNLSQEAAALDDTASAEDYGRLIINLAATGVNPYNVEGADLVDELMSMQGIDDEGSVSVMLALAAYDAVDAEEAPDILNSRDILLQKLLLYQNADGGFSEVKGLDSDTSVTALAITAMSPYLSKVRVREAAESALRYLSARQNDDGGFLRDGAPDCIATARVLSALSSLEWAGYSQPYIRVPQVVGALMTYYKDNGSFSDVPSGESDIAATEQALAALCAARSNQNPFELTGGYSGDDSAKNSFGIWQVLLIVLAVLAAAVTVAVVRQRKKKDKINRQDTQ